MPPAAAEDGGLGTREAGYLIPLPAAAGRPQRRPSRHAACGGCWQRTRHPRGGMPLTLHAGTHGGLGEDCRGVPPTAADGSGLGTRGAGCLGKEGVSADDSGPRGTIRRASVHVSRFAVGSVFRLLGRAMPSANVPYPTWRGLASDSRVLRLAMDLDETGILAERERELARREEPPP